MKEKGKLTGSISFIVGILVLITFEYILHHKCVFVMDDLWYSTNLATGESLQNFGDIIEGQIWHFYHWGGRNVTHGILQLTLMSGEVIANILNLIMAVLLAFMICILSNQTKPAWFLLASSLLISFNPNIKDSMFWQSGTVNYVYSTVWILVFLWVYLRETLEKDSIRLPLISVWVIPLGLITGWSNENMGPASFVISVAVIIYLWKFMKRKPPVWMYLGSLFSLIGSAFVILAPGNFVREAEIPDTNLWSTISERLLSMLRAGMDYLFPVAAFMLAVLFIYVAVCKKQLKPFEWLLLAHAALSYGAMILSPHYPDRATFGTMCVCITVIISALGKLSKEKEENNRYIYLFTFCIWIYAVYKLIQHIITL